MIPRFASLTASSLVFRPLMGERAPPFLLGRISPGAPHFLPFLLSSPTLIAVSDSGLLSGTRFIFARTSLGESTGSVSASHSFGL
jgi:hypothetical protein